VKEQEVPAAANCKPLCTGSVGSPEAFIDSDKDQATKGRRMPQDSEQPEELSSDIKMFCALLARIMYRCLKERDPRLLALLKESASGHPPEGEDSTMRSEDIPDQSA
jgi:hypothetical protein